MDEDGSIPVQQASGGVAVATYVSLFLLLFVFFIVLVSISEVQRPRARAVIDSVDAAFGHLPSALGLIEAPPAPRPETVSVESFARDVTGLLTGFAPLARTTLAASSDSFLEISLPEDSVFEPGSATLKAEVLPTLDRLSLILQHHASGPAIRMTWHAMLSTEAPQGGPAERLAGLRAATVAARLYVKGCPGGALAIAVERGSGPAFRLDFAVLNGDEPDAGAAP
ncbi:MAG: hypothetical protein JWO51_1265 [Rhodospirillales bacterium]|nr:hypothetical protein [Rhodospirillales bacterium]